MSRTPFRTRIKFCGLTRVGDVRLASELGVDAIGFVFAAGSPRRVCSHQSRALRTALGPLVDAVAVFRDNPIDEVRQAIEQLRPSLLQFHGGEDGAFCRSFNLPYLKAISIDDSQSSIDTVTLLQQYSTATGFLFDGAAPGSGRRFDWSRLPTGLDKPFMLSGGLDASNVLEAIQTTLPWGVDASSGIERSPGLKDGEKMRQFVEQVRRADCHVELDQLADRHPGTRSCQ